MATTWIKALHRSGGSVAAALELRVDYAKDIEKTNGGKFVEGYGCDPYTAQSEFLFSKRLYEQKTGRDQGKHDVIAYHIRMSFQHGEVTAEQALALGREIAFRWTRGRHQFIVAAHTNTKNPHCHIVYNSTNLDCDGKYQDFKRPAIALRRLSDQICLEHGLSIIEKPGLSKGYNRNEYLGDNKPPTVRDQLRDLMDTALTACKDFDAFLAALKASGVEIKRGKQLAFRLPGGKKFSRQDSLGEDYSKGAILERISGKRVVKPKQKATTSTISTTKPNMLIDIQAKIQQGYGAGYEDWAKIFNLKEASRTLIYLQEKGLADYEDLSKAASDSSAWFRKLSEKIKSGETRMNEIKELQKHIGTYSKTREVYQQYRASDWDKDFYEIHRADITLHKAAKKYFDSLGYGKDKKLPTMDALKKEYAVLASGRGKLYSEYKQARQKMIELQTAKHNVDRVLGEPRLQPKTYERDAL